MFTSTIKSSSSSLSSNSDSIPWELILIYFFYTFGFILFLGISLFYIWWKKNCESEKSTVPLSEPSPMINGGISQTSGTLGGHVLLLSTKDGELDNLKTCRFFFQPEYIHIPSRMDALGAVLNLGNPESGEFTSIFPVKGSLFLKLYRGPHQGVVHNKSKVSVGLAGEGKRSYLQVNDSIFNFVFEVEAPYDFSHLTLGNITLMQPPSNSFGICGYVKREEEGIRFVKTFTAARFISDILNIQQNHALEQSNLFTKSSIIHQIIVPLADTGYSVGTNHAIAWIPNRGILDPPQITPPSDLLIPQGLKGKVPFFESSLSNLQVEDVTEKMRKWVGTLLKETGDFNSGNTTEFRIKYQNLKIGNRFSIGWSEYFNHQYNFFQHQNSIHLSLLELSSASYSIISSKSSANLEKSFEKFVLDVMTRELAPFLSVFSVRKFEPLGKGVVLVQTTTEPLHWLKSWNDDPTLNRQWVINYCAVKDLKKLFTDYSSDSSPLHGLDQNSIMKNISDINFKTQFAVLMIAKHTSAFHISPLIPSNELCKKCTALSSKVDTLIINCDLQINKFSTINFTSQIIKKNL